MGRWVMAVALLVMAVPGYAATEEDVYNELQRRLYTRETTMRELIQSARQDGWNRGYKAGHDDALLVAHEVSQPNFGNRVAQSVAMLGGGGGATVLPDTRKKSYSYYDEQGGLVGSVREDY